VLRPTKQEEEFGGGHKINRFRKNVARKNKKKTTNPEDTERVDMQIVLLGSEPVGINVRAL